MQMSRPMVEKKMLVEINGRTSQLEETKVTIQFSSFLLARINHKG